MNTDTLLNESWAGLKNGVESGRLAHAYIFVGPPRGAALEFVENFLKLLFCESPEKPCNTCPSCRKVDAHSHVDTLWIEPQSKSRQIKAEEIRELVRRVAQTSFEGGWKAGVILAADCMNTASANVLLKTLEEPPPRTVLLLVTDAPQALLPTIHSRCQKIVLPVGGAALLQSAWAEPLMDILQQLPPVNGLAAARLADRLHGLFGGLKTEIAESVRENLEEAVEAVDETKLKVILEARTSAQLKEVQSEVLSVMTDWQRDVLMLASGLDTGQLVFREHGEVLKEQAAMHSKASALAAVQLTEEMSRRLGRNIPEAQVLDEAFRKLVRR